jgi:hypothetical protein
MFSVEPIEWSRCSGEDEVDVVFGFDAAGAVLPDDAGDDVEEGLALSAPGVATIRVDRVAGAGAARGPAGDALWRVPRPARARLREDHLGYRTRRAF